jgi:protein-tyrosine phosphatase
VSFHVLHVCTGNICRSPMAEYLMRAGLSSPEIEVSSAGTHGLVGERVQKHAAAVLTARGIDAKAFRARRLDEDLVSGADLVLTATRKHRAAAVLLEPRASARAFTLREFDRLLSAVDPTGLPLDPEQRARALVVAAAAQRGLIRPDRPEDDDIDDPYGEPASQYPVCGALIEASLGRWLALMCA